MVPDDPERDRLHPEREEPLLEPRSHEVAPLAGTRGGSRVHHFIADGREGHAERRKHANGANAPRLEDGAQPGVEMERRPGPERPGMPPRDPGAAPRELADADPSNSLENGPLGRQDGIDVIGYRGSGLEAPAREGGPSFLGTRDPAGPTRPARADKPQHDALVTGAGSRGQTVAVLRGESP